MSRYRILHVDDEPDIREVAEISLALDTDFDCRSCGSGAEALVLAADWLPDLILMDVMMPVMDGPATLLGLLAKEATATIPVVFMTARAQTRELDQFRALGAVGVIPKPFDPMTLAAAVRPYIKPKPEFDLPDSLHDGFALRLGRDVAALNKLRTALKDGADASSTLARITQIAHGLSGAGGIFGYGLISAAAADLEDAAMTEQASAGSGAGLDAALARLTAQAAQPGPEAMLSRLPRRPDVGGDTGRQAE